MTYIYDLDMMQLLENAAARKRLQSWMFPPDYSNTWKKKETLLSTSKFLQRLHAPFLRTSHIKFISNFYAHIKHVSIPSRFQSDETPAHFSKKRWIQTTKIFSYGCTSPRYFHCYSQLGHFEESRRLIESLNHSWLSSLPHPVKTSWIPTERVQALCL